VTTRRTGLPGIVYAGLLLGLCLGAYEVFATLRRVGRWYRRKAGLFAPLPAVQIALWWALMLSAPLIWLLLSPPIGLILLLAAQLIPLEVKARPKTVQPAVTGER